LYSGEIVKAREFAEKAYSIDPNHLGILIALGEIYYELGQYEQALNYYKKWVERLDSLGILKVNYMHRVAYVYWINGYKEEAEYYFSKQIDYCNWNNELGREEAQQLWTYYDLAAGYAFRGEKDKAYENLRIFNQRKTVSYWLLAIFRKDPLFNSIRDEPEFQQILQDAETKYQAEHERVMKWLEENDML
jgi:tetratricopeptide (TPR) repeat protein